MKKHLFLLLAGCSILLSGCRGKKMPADFQTDKLYSYLPYNDMKEVSFTCGDDTIIYKLAEGRYAIEEYYWPQGTQFPNDNTCQEKCRKSVQLVANDSIKMGLMATCKGRKIVVLSFNWQQGVWRDVDGFGTLTTDDVSQIYDIMTDTVYVTGTHHHGMFVRNKGLIYYTDADGKRWTLAE